MTYFRWFFYGGAVGGWVPLLFNLIILGTTDKRAILYGIFWTLFALFLWFTS